jgi:2,4-diaminopentanoate dehydrogenase
VKVYSDSKNGVDAGTLVGRRPIGVAATTDDEAILGLEADCVLYTPRNGDIGEVCRLLASGKNVATTVFLFYPPRLPDAERRRLEAACREGDTTFHASGINPGNLSGVLPLALSGMSRTIDKITLQERADMTLYDSTDISFTRNASIAEHAQAANIATGMQVLNAVPAVCEAPAGFATNATLPLIRCGTGFSSHRERP